MRCLLNLDQLKGTEACGSVEAEIDPAGTEALRLHSDEQALQPSPTLKYLTG